MDGPREKKLTDVGTRYEHLADLRDVWQIGVAAVDVIQERYISAADKTLKASLESAIRLINRQLDIMSSFDTEKFKVARVVDSIPRNSTGMPGE